MLRLTSFNHISSSRIVVNGVSGRRIYDVRGLRQGDPLSPLLFVLAMDALTALITQPEGHDTLNGIPGVSSLQRLSMYAEDAVIFVRPVQLDLICIRNILNYFGEASVFHVIYNKSSTIKKQYNSAS